MKRPSGPTLATGVIALLIGVAIGGASGVEDGIDAAIDQPTPQVIVVTPAPQEQPTPRIETVTETVIETIEVVPEVCEDALWAADMVIGDTAQFSLDVLGAYVDYPDEDLVEFGRRVEDIISAADVDESDRLWDEYTSLADSCLSR